MDTENRLSFGMTDSLEYYEQNGARFIEGSVNVDISDKYAHFLPLLPSGARILDLGCGSGRDSRNFLDRGFDVTSVDGSKAMCGHTEKLTGRKALNLRFDEIDFKNEFDGIWACASLLHVPKDSMHEILCRISAALKPGGILYASYKYGSSEREKEGRFFSDYTEKDLPELLPEDTGLRLTEYWISDDARPEEKMQWLNIIAEKQT